MTTLTRPVVRRIQTPEGDFVVTLAPAGLSIRRHRARTSYGPIDYSHLELKLAELTARQARTRRKAVRRGAITPY